MNNSPKVRLHFILLVIVFHLLFPGNARAKRIEKKSKMEFLFIEWKDKENQLLLGHYENRSKRIIDIKCSPETLTDAQLQTWLKGNKAILLFHCMWGQQPLFHKIKYLNTLDEIVDSLISNDVVAISFLWHAGGVKYKNNWENSYDKGKSLSAVLQRINLFYAGNSSVLCHSMGTRFFEGALSDHAVSPPFKQVILFSSDISSNTADPGFVSILQSTRQISIFQHRKDKMLLMSSRVHGEKRIGRTGPVPEVANTTVYDMTDHIHGFQNHAHVNKRWAKEQLKILLR
jgi:Alpha/beta hydrolase of unknown function (DUF900)